MSATALMYDPVFTEHLVGPGAPETPGRVQAIANRLAVADFADRLATLAPRPADEADLLACHAPGYLSQVRADIANGCRQLSTGDTDICPASLDVAVRAVGGVCRAVEEVVAGRFSNAFCVVRPPGHHATVARGMGFCMFNNAAVAARYAQRRCGMGKVLIVDWDIHHGNGTQDIFYEDPSVFYFSTHQSPLYPGTGRADETGAGPGVGTTRNCPFPPGAGRDEVVGAMADKLLPAARTFRPDLVIISAGFDSREGDPLGRFHLTDADFSEMTAMLMSLADETASGRLVSTLEGGYSLTGLASAAESHVRTLCNADA